MTTKKEEIEMQNVLWNKNSMHKTYQFGKLDHNNTFESKNCLNAIKMGYICFMDFLIVLIIFMIFDFFNNSIKRTTDSDVHFIFNIGTL